MSILGDNMIRISNLTKTFNNKVILDNINVNFEKEMISVIFGKSGEGKTTLFRIIAELEEADSGEIVYYEKNQIGMVFQNNQLYPHLSALNNLVIPQRVVKKIPKKTAEKRAIEVLDSLNIEYLKSQYPSKLSGGEQQRLAIARALVMDKKILLLDEPTSSLDSENIEILIEILNELKRKGKTIIVITHDKGFAEKLADNIFELKDNSMKIILNIVS